MTSPLNQEESFFFQVGDDGKKIRLDRFLADQLRSHGISREKIKCLIRDGRVTVDALAATTARREVTPGERIEVRIPPNVLGLQEEEGEISVIYRDSQLAVLDKPAGITVHPAPGLESGTLVHRLISHFPELKAQEGLRPGIVHRLDKDTSGLMLIALTEQVRLALAGQFARHEIFKEYLAIVYGVPEREGCVEAPIGRHPTQKTRMAVTKGGRSAKSVWRRLYADPEGRFSLLAVRIFSGRTHQIRVHMQHIGHALLGDAVYKPLPGQAGQSTLSDFTSATEDAVSGFGSALPVPASRQMLHAWKLQFRPLLPEKAGCSLPADPKDCDPPLVSFTCPPPSDFTDCLEKLMTRTLKVIVTGSPGCGKSALTEFLKTRGVPVFSADAEIARAYEPGNDGHRLLRLHYGDRFVPSLHDAVNKHLLGSAMRENDCLRREIENLLHPLIWHSLKKFWASDEAALHGIAVAEIPLYLESGQRDADLSLAEECRPVLVGVHCPFQLREQRLLSKRGWTQDLIASMESWQWPEEAKIAACDMVVNNTGTLDELEAESMRLADALAGLRLQRARTGLSRVSRFWDSGPEVLCPSL